MEFGPRALGNRSILGDPRDSEMQRKMNLKIKYRESFRPFAPSVLEEDYRDFLQMNLDHHICYWVDQVNQKHRKELPENYSELAIEEKLYFERSDIPCGYTCRLFCKNPGGK